MALFKIKSTKALPLFEKKFDSVFPKEKNIQNFTEANLQEILNLEFVSTEFNLENFWLDSLAFDPVAKSFVIIEYKKVENFSLMDQGQTYLNLLFGHKAEVILEYNEKLNKNLKRADIDWDQTRVIFIGPKFNTYQKRALNPSLPFELWEVAVYEEGIIEYDPVTPLSSEKMPQKTKTALIGKAASEIKIITFEDHLQRASDKTKDLLMELRQRIFELDNRIQEKPVNNYLGYKLNWYNFVSVHVFKDKLKVYVRKDNFISDKRKQMTKIPESYKWGKTPLWWIDVLSDKTIDYLMPIIKESYENAPDKK